MRISGFITLRCSVSWQWQPVSRPAPENSRKLSLSRDDLYASDVFVDPLVTASLPWSITLASGLDALFHALESLWNVNASPLTRTLAQGAARDLMAGLRRLHYDLSDVSARLLMVQGATAAGLAFSNTQTALAHNISYPITLEHNVPHGIACSFCLPEVMTAAIGVDVADDQEVPATPEAFGIGARQWRAIVEAGFPGPRGRNFIGRIERFPGLAPAPVATMWHSTASGQRHDNADQREHRCPHAPRRNTLARFHTTLTIALGVGWALDSFETNIIGSVFGVLKQQWSLT